MWTTFDRPRVQRPHPAKILRACVRFAFAGWIGWLALLLACLSYHAYKWIDPVPHGMLDRTPPELHRALKIEFRQLNLGRLRTVPALVEPEYRKVIEAAEDPKLRFEATWRLALVLDKPWGDHLKAAELYVEAYELTLDPQVLKNPGYLYLARAHECYMRAGEKEEADALAARAQTELDPKSLQGFQRWLSRRDKQIATQLATRPVERDDLLGKDPHVTLHHIRKHRASGWWRLARHAPWMTVVLAATIAVIFGNARRLPLTSPKCLRTAVPAAMLVFLYIVPSSSFSKLFGFTVPHLSVSFQSVFLRNMNLAVHAAMGILLLCLLVPAILYFLLRRRRDLLHLTFGRVSPLRSIAWFLLIALIGYVVAVLLRALRVTSPAPEWAILHVGEEAVSVWLVLAGSYAVILAPAFEELIYRGLLQGTLATRLPEAAAIILSAAVFTLSHSGGLAWSRGVVPFYALIGVLTGVLYSRTRGLFAPFLLHTLVNTVATLLAASGQ